MSIAFDAAIHGQVGAASSLTYSHTVGGGSNRILFVGVDAYANTITTTGITYAGIALTKITSQINSIGGESSLWYLFAPSSGVHNVVVTASGSSTIFSNASSYTGAKQSGVPDAFSSNSHSGNATNTIISIADNCWHVVQAFNDGDNTDAGSGSTKRSDDFQNSTFFDNNAAITPAGSNSMTINCINANNTYLEGATFAPAPVLPVTGGSFLTTL